VLIFRHSDRSCYADISRGIHPREAFTAIQLTRKKDCEVLDAPKEEGRQLLMERTVPPIGKPHTLKDFGLFMKETFPSVRKELLIPDRKRQATFHSSTIAV